MIISSTYSANLYDISHRKPFKRTSNLKCLGPRKWKFASDYSSIL